MNLIFWKYRKQKWFIIHWDRYQICKKYRKSLTATYYFDSEISNHAMKKAESVLFALICPWKSPDRPHTFYIENTILSACNTAWSFFDGYIQGFVPLKPSYFLCYLPDRISPRHKVYQMEPILLFWRQCSLIHRQSWNSAVPSSSTASCNFSTVQPCNA